MLKLSDTGLFRTEAYVAGVWTGAAQRFAVFNPATQTEIATVPNMGPGHVNEAVAAAAAAFPAWRGLTARERSRILRRWFDLIMAHQEDLACLITTEQGKPLAEARGEVAYAASFVEWFAEEAKRVYGDVIPHPDHGSRIVVLKQPIGVCAAITPWNFPAAMIARKAAPALAAGCTMVVKPAEQTPLTALALGELAERAGIPAGVLNIVTCDAASAPAVGATLTGHEDVRKVTFTGSTQVGRILMRDSAVSIKKVSLELGGNSPFIIFDDADLGAAVEGVMASKFRNSGQTCVCANRIFVQAGIYDRFVKHLGKAISRLNVGNGLEVGVNQGPLIDIAGVEKVESHIADAVTKGARVVMGGSRHAKGGTFFEPTVLTGVTREMRLFDEETFGPVAPLMRFETEAQVIVLANDSPFGLAAYLYSRDIGRAWRVAEELESGMVGVNAGFISNEVAPFGGIKQSGLGREGSYYGLEEYLEIKYLCMGGISQ
ncbi:MAG: NAD-dependent succinate-semialdehyde dehydrogenase [Rhodospirillaceae bacterium]|nr:MAG: NAD-dependent succinate-semialdehyde dehydrogenase [Rhodospirillaceae bacterium]